MELFPTAMSPWVDQTTGYSIVAGSLLQFKLHIETATKEGRMICLYEPEFPQDLAFKAITALFLHAS